MKYTTFDMELADRVLPSICEISIIDWDNGKITDRFDSLINPDCDIENFFRERRTFNEKTLMSSPLIGEAWIDIYNHLENKIVFSHNANRNFSDLKKLADINYLNMPNFIFGCTASITKRVWPYIDSAKLQDITEILKISDIHFTASGDAFSIGQIISLACKDVKARNIDDFFKKTGFSGGVVYNGKKYAYSATKDKNGEYAANVIIKEEIYEIDFSSKY